MSALAAAAPAVELRASDLPAFCPNPSMPPWASHPRVFLDVVNESEAMCPYCGTRYRLKRGAHVRTHEFDTRELHQDRHQQYAAQPAIDPQATERLTHSRESPEVAVDALGNTTLEQMTRWLKKGSMSPAGASDRPAGHRREANPRLLVAGNTVFFPAATACATFVLPASVFSMLFRLRAQTAAGASNGRNGM